MKVSRNEALVAAQVFLFKLWYIALSALPNITSFFRGYKLHFLDVSQTYFRLIQLCCFICDC